MIVRPLLPGDVRTGFASGDVDLDRFFVRFAGQNQFKHHIGTTWVAVEGESILGFVTLSAGEIRTSTLGSKRLAKLPNYPLPALRIARLAVSAAARGRGVGSHLMLAAFQAALRMAAEFGCVGVLVDAKADAVAFYERFGFEAVGLVAGSLGERPVPTTMFLELGAIR